jgi:hypothetical protein
VGRFCVGFAILALWLSATPSADACPPGSPCLKYRQQTVNVQPEYYARAGGGTIPSFDRKKLARYLATRWKPVFGDGNGPAAKPQPSRYYKVTYVKNDSSLQLVDPTRKIPAAKKNERVVLIRQIERDHDGNVFVDVDGIAYQLWYCASGKQAVPCLTNSGNAFSSMFPVDDSAEPQPVLKPIPF